MDWDIKALYSIYQPLHVYVNYICSVTLYTLSKTILLIWFNVNTDVLPAFQVLVYLVAKFDKTYQHWGLSSYNRRTGKARSSIKIFKSY